MAKVSLPTGQEKKQYVQNMFDEIAPTYEKANRFISLGLDNYARKIALEELRTKPKSKIIDLASGTGDFSRMIESAGSIPFACDLSFGMLSNDSTTKNRIQCDGTVMPFQDNSFDGLVCGYGLRNFVNLDDLFIEIMRVLKPGARLSAVDVSVPTNPLLKLGNRLWISKIAPKIGWLISNNKEAYEYLPRSTAYLPSRNLIENQLRKAGAENINISNLFGGSLILISATKKINWDES